MEKVFIKRNHLLQYNGFVVIKSFEKAMYQKG